MREAVSQETLRKAQTTLCVVFFFSGWVINLNVKRRAIGKFFKKKLN